MAFEVGSLIINVKADITKLSQGLRIAKGEAKSFVGAVSNVGAELTKTGKKFLMFGIAAGAMGGFAIATFAKFEQAIANTGSVLGSTGEQLKELGSAAREMGKTTVFSATEAAQAMYFLASAGYDTQQTIGALEGTLALAAATQHDLAETTATVVSVLNAFQMQAEESTRVSNVFAAVISASQATMYRLGESMKYVAPIAAALNISLEDTTAALGILYDNGLSASQAGTNLRMALLKLVNPTAQAHEAMESLGLNFKDLNPETNSLVDIIGKLENVNLTAGKAAKIFGVRSVTAMLALRNAGSEAFTALSGKITGTNKATEMAAIQINTLRGSFKLLVSAIQEVMIQLGEGIGGALKGIVDGVTQVILWFGNLNPIIKTVMSSFIILTAAIGIFGGVALMAVGSITKVLVAMKALNIALVSTMGIVGAVIVGLGLLVGALYAVGRASKDGSVERAIALGKMKEEYANINSLVSQYKKLKNKLASLTPASKEYNKVLAELSKVKSDLVAVNPLFLESLSDTGEVLDVNVGKVGEYNKELRENIELLEKLEKKRLAEELKEAQTAFKEMGGEIKKTKQYLSDLKTVKGVGGFLGKGAEETTKRVEKELEKLITTYRETADTIGELKEKLAGPVLGPPAPKEKGDLGEKEISNEKEVQAELANLRIAAIKDRFEKELATIDNWEAQKLEKYKENEELHNAIAEAAQVRRDEVVQEHMEHGRVLAEAEVARLKGIKDKEVADFEEAERKKQRAAEKTAFYVASLASKMGVAIADSAQGYTDAWRNALKSMVSMFAGAIRAEIGILLAKYIAAMQWGQAAVAAAKIGVVSGLETAAIGAIDRAQEGGVAKGTTRGGSIVRVGENFTPEVILPLNKLPQMLPALAGSAGGMGEEGGGGNINIDVNLTGSVLSADDEDMANAFYEKVLLPAKKRLVEEHRSIDSFEEAF